MRVYAGQAITGIIQDSENTHYVGFSLPSASVSPIDVRASSDFWFYIGYVVSSIVLYVTCITTIHFLVSKSDKESVKCYFTEKHPEVLLGVTIVIVIFIILEVIAEFIMAIIWTVHVSDPLISFFIFVSAFVYFAPVVISLSIVIIENRKSRTKTSKSTKFTLKINLIFEIFVCISAYFVYILLYSFFPAFVLAFAYPTRIITIFAFVFAFMVLSIVYLTTYIKHVHSSIQRWGKKWKKGVAKLVCFSSLLTIVLLYFFLFIFALLYSLVIGRASVVSSAPLAVLSLLPSILISVAAWIMKSTMLKNTKSDKQEDVDSKVKGEEDRECKADHMQSYSNSKEDDNQNQSAAMEMQMHLNDDEV